MTSIYQTFRRICNVICWVLTIHLVNYSIDPPHSPIIESKVDQTINEFESIAELIVEELFGYQDTFKDFDHVNGEGDFANTFEYCSSRPILNNENISFYEMVRFPITGPAFLNSPEIGILVPPPETAQS